MICLTNSSVNKFYLLFVVASVCLNGCAAAPAKPISLQGVAQNLRFLSLSPDKAAPQAAEMATVRWRAEASGGVGDRTVEFRIHDGKGEVAAQKGPSPTWDWSPGKPGSYRVKAVVRDSIGNTVDSGWSPEYIIHPFLKVMSRIAILPLENLSGSPAPLNDIKKRLIERMKGIGIGVLDDEMLEKFMERHRMRYTGGIDQELGKAFRKETGVEAVLVFSLELYSESNPPRIAFTARLISTGESTSILWMDSAGLAGDETPGILDLGIVVDPQKLLSLGMDRIMNSLKSYRSGEKSKVSRKGLRDSRRAARIEKRFQPKRFFRAPDFAVGGDKVLTIAVMPFINRTTRSYAGEIMARHFMRRLWEADDIEVVEQGVLRQELLKVRIIMADGLSIPQAEALFSLLDVDLILVGNLLDYQDREGLSGTNRIQFSVQILEKKSRSVVWNSESYNRGEDGVFFFDWGKIGSSHALASEMARAVVDRVLKKDFAGAN